MSRLTWLTILPFTAGLSVASAQTVSGPLAPSLSSLDNTVLQLMSKWQIPGAALGVTKDGRLVLAHGYGYADRDTLEPVQPDSLFRIASISKPFTAAAILKLIEMGKLSLNSLAFTILNNLSPPPGQSADPRVYQITVRQLLEHTAGWDRDLAVDPPFAYAVSAATQFGAQPPATPTQLIRFMLGKPLQHNPGSTYSYSNFGYIVLGAIIERVSAQTYEDFVRTQILQPGGILRMRPGSSLVRAADEVKYYDYPGAPLLPSVFTTAYSLVPVPYGNFSVELMLANGGWIASTMDLLRYVDNLNGQLTPGILAAPPSGFVGYVPPVGNGWWWYFFGSLPGTSAILHLDTGVRLNRVSFSLLFNTRQAGSPSPDILNDADAQITAALAAIQTWPSGDLFPTFSGSSTACAFSLTAPGMSVGPGGGTGSVGVTATNNCAWRATSNHSWITIQSGVTGAGSGTVGFQAASSTTARTGTITIAGQTFTVTQSGLSPSLSIAKTHSGSFVRGQNGAVYQVTVSNSAGTAPTSGTATVTESLPAGLTLVSMSGTGWTCPPGGSTCTRSDALAAGASYPAITVTVNVAAGATSPRVNTVTVSGGNSPSSTATDSTVILASATTPSKAGIFRAGTWIVDRNGDGQWNGAPPDFLAYLGQANDSHLVGDWNGAGTAKGGIFRAGLWILDYNGNGQWDGPAVDRFFYLGQAGDTPVLGDWNGDGKTKAGIFRAGLWILDYNGNGQWDGPAVDRFFYLGQAGDNPLVGDWNGDGKTKAGIFRAGLWVLDYNGNGLWDGPSTDRFFYLGQAGDTPLIGDWNGDGRVKAGVFRAGLWVLDYNGNGLWDGPSTDRFFYLGQAGDTPLIGDWNGDGRAKGGIFRAGLWVLDKNGNGQWDGPPSDIFFYLGQAGDAAAVGKW